MKLIVKEMRRGFTLIELAAVLAVLVVLMGIIGMTMLTLVRIEQADTEFYGRLLAQGSLAERFRADVAQARNAPEQWGRFRAGKHCLILERERDGFVIYERINDRLQRRMIQGGKEALEAMPAAIGEATFLRGVPNLIMLRLVPDTASAKRYPAEFAAALGGELR